MRPEAEDRLEEAARFGITNFYVSECERGGYAIRRGVGYNKAETWFFINRRTEARSVLQRLGSIGRV